MHRDYVNPTCPVCNMDVAQDAPMREYRGVKHRFCSQQCRLRFERHPHLFVGDPRLGRSEKQKGKAVKKMRRITLKETPDHHSMNRIIDGLRALMGIESIAFNGPQILVVYDLMQVSFEEIENAVVKAHVALQTKVTETLRRCFIHYTEECELDNLAHLTRDSGRY